MQNVGYVSVGVVYVAGLLVFLIVLVRRRLAVKRRQERLADLIGELDRDAGAILMAKNLDRRVFIVYRHGDHYRVTEGDASVVIERDEVLHRLQGASDPRVRRLPSQASRDS